MTCFSRRSTPSTKSCRGVTRVEPAIGRYVESLSGYTKNTFPELSAQERGSIAREWRRCFDEWGYAIQ